MWATPVASQQIVVMMLDMFMVSHDIAGIWVAFFSRSLLLAGWLSDIPAGASVGSVCGERPAVQAGRAEADRAGAPDPHVHHATLREFRS